jgi:hypothetical protein
VLSEQVTRRDLLRRAGACALGFAGWAAAQSREANPQRWVYDITDFEHGLSNGWLPGFTDFSLATASTNRRAEIRRLPQEIQGAGRYGYYLRGHNTSDDLFMFIKKPVTTLAPNREYTVEFHIQFASSAGSGCVGIGGAPGESVWLKAGASTEEPVAIMENDDIRLSADKGNQSSGGRDALIVSDIANGIQCEEAEGEFVLLRRTARLESAVRTDGAGRLWVFLGTDSGFEGTTEIYYAFIAALFTLRD